MTPDNTNTAKFTARIAALEAHSQAREERIGLLEEENRWLKAQLFGRSSEKSPVEDQNPDQAWLFDTGRWQTEDAGAVSQSIAIPAPERHKRGRRRLSAHLPRVDVIHDLPDEAKVWSADGTDPVRSGEEISG